MTTRDILTGGAIAILVGMLVVALLNPSYLGPSLVILLVLGAIVVSLHLGAAGERPYHLIQPVPLPPRAIEAHALRWFAVGGWALTGSHPGALAFTRRSAPSLGVALVLLFFGVLPGLLYLMLGGRRLTLTLLTAATPGGTALEIVVNTSASGGQAAAARFFNSLHGLVHPST